MKKYMYILGIIALITLVAYLESPNSPLAHPNEGTNMYSSIPSVEDSDSPGATEANSNVENAEEEAVLTSLELKLEKTELVDGYIIETYREYEIYNNEAGEVIESVPTEHYEYLKYLDE
ncbi:Uncharacterised protein [Mycobacteroides abscessus subsp. abscessus]|nr:Uncharacterised protein [Mycobacteroides abscessus subsp. abscessus]